MRYSKYFGKGLKAKRGKNLKYLAILILFLCFMADYIVSYETSSNVNLQEEKEILSEETNNGSEVQVSAPDTKRLVATEDQKVIPKEEKTYEIEEDIA